MKANWSSEGSNDEFYVAGSAHPLTFTQPLHGVWGKGIQTGARYSTAAIEAEEGVSTATVAADVHGEGHYPVADPDLSKTTMLFYSCTKDFLCQFFAF
ncbi:MAG: hypothetical protein HN348_10685 [Proteobacteria bacterium]|nr:hypothetical protein [Pseudomonadota bacterium]